MTKTTEELIQEVGKILMELRKDPSKEAVPEVLHTLLLQIAEAAKQEERERIAKEMERLDSNWSIAGNNFKRIYEFVTAPRSEDNPSKDE